MYRIIAKWALAILVSGAIGLGLGMKIERANQFDLAEELRKKAERDLELQKQMDAERIRALVSIKDTEIERYQKLLKEAEAEVELNRRLAKQNREVANGLKQQIESLRGRISDGSSCVFDPGDIGLLNDAVRAANRIRGNDVP